MARDETEESKSMLSSAQPQPTSEPEPLDMDETTPAALESGSRRPHFLRLYSKSRESIQGLYANANACAAFRCFFSFPLLGSAIYILAAYPRPSPNPTVIPFAAYCLGCATFHIALATHRVIQPRSPTSALPPRGYMIGLVISPVLLFLAWVYGLVVIGLTKGYYGQRDMTRLEKCGRRSRTRRCHPKTPEAMTFDLTIVCMSFAFVTLCCSLKQCYHIYCIWWNRYTEEEIDQAARSVGKSTFMSIMREMFGGCYQRVTGWKRASQHDK